MEEKIIEIIVDRLLQRHEKLGWQSWNGAESSVYASYFEIAGNLFVITLQYSVNRVFITQGFHVTKPIYQMRIYNSAEKGRIAGPLVFETEYRAEKFYKLVDVKIKADWDKQYPPQKIKKPMSPSEAISFLSKNL